VFYEKIRFVSDGIFCLLVWMKWRGPITHQSLKRFKLRVQELTRTGRHLAPADLVPCHNKRLFFILSTSKNSDDLLRLITFFAHLLASFGDQSFECSPTLFNLPENTEEKQA
jgi:hypothetical protein